MKVLSITIFEQLQNYPIDDEDTLIARWILTGERGA
jgi:hypothetical protein